MKTFDYRLSCVKIVVFNLAWLFAMTLGVEAQNLLPTSVPDQKPNCGVRSVVALAKFVGKTVSDQDFKQLCRDYSNDQVSLWDVKRMAERVGLQL